jgi:MYXO-CTERM domain-containing protein
MNMTPTCVCDQGFVAVGGIDAAGARAMNCVTPPELVPPSFYQRALAPLPEALPGGRPVTITDPAPMQSTGEGGENPDVIPPASVDFPMPRFDPSVPGSDTFVQATPSRSSGACNVSHGRPSGPGLGFAAALVLGLAALRRRRRS